MLKLNHKNMASPAKHIH